MAAIPLSLRRQGAEGRSDALRSAPGALPAHPATQGDLPALPMSGTQPTPRPDRVAGARGEKAAGAQTFGSEQSEGPKTAVGAELAASPQPHSDCLGTEETPLPLLRLRRCGGSAARRVGQCRTVQLTAGCRSWPPAWEDVRLGGYLFQGSRKHHMSDTSGGAALQPGKRLPGSMGLALPEQAAARRGARTTAPHDHPSPPGKVQEKAYGAHHRWLREIVVLGKLRLQGSWVPRNKRQCGKPKLVRGGMWGKTSTESPGSPERSVRKGQYQGGNQRPDPDIMDLHHPGTQPSNILPSISKTEGWKRKVFQSPACFSRGICLFSRESS